MNPLGDNGGPRRRNSAFFGDSGTQLSEEARDQIEHGDEGAGHKGNNVDFSQRYAQSEADEREQLDPQAEGTIKTLKEMFPHGFYNTGGAKPYQHTWGDPESESKLREMLRGKSGAKTNQQDEKEEPFLSREADNKFWASDEPKKVMPKRL